MTMCCCCLNVFEPTFTIPNKFDIISLKIFGKNFKNGLAKNLFGSDVLPKAKNVVHNYNTTFLTQLIRKSKGNRTQLPSRGLRVKS
jgi:hypothetical protein